MRKLTWFCACLAVGSGGWLLAADPGKSPATTLSEQEAFAGATSVSGLVYWDDNGNGRRDPSEAPAEGVRLSADYQVVTTDSAGRYAYQSERPFLVVSLDWPGGTWPTANWFVRMTRDRQTDADFGLCKEPEQTPFLFVHATDLHENLAATAKQICRECRSLPMRPKFYIVTGDLRHGTAHVDNVPEIRKDFGEMKEMIGTFNAPVFLTPGNHDVVDLAAIGKSLPAAVVNHPLFGQKAWEKFVGPAYWSFGIGDVTFLGWEWAQYQDDQWAPVGKSMADWAAEKTKAIPKGGRLIVSGHAARPLGGVILGLSGHSHDDGPVRGDLRLQAGGIASLPWDKEHPKEGRFLTYQRVLQSVPVRDQPGRERKFGADGRPAGYRIVVVEKDRIDHFYMPFDEPRAIQVLSPRREEAIRTPIALRGQVFDPQGKLSDVTASYAGKSLEVTRTARRLWSDLEASIDPTDLEAGFHDLTVTARWPDGDYRLTQPYLALAAKESPFTSPADDAVLEGRIEKLTAEVTIKINGSVVGTVAADAKTFRLTVDRKLLRRLNRIELEGSKGAAISDVCLTSGKTLAVDQRQVSVQSNRRALTPESPLWIDFAQPGPAVNWSVERSQP